eukprot:5538472-Alexandrium_andersonii.AAC.1
MKGIGLPRCGFRSSRSSACGTDSSLAGKARSLSGLRRAFAKGAPCCLCLSLIHISEPTRLALI